jgi:hypothetical protein
MVVLFTVALLLTFLVGGIRSPGQLQGAGRDVWAQADQPHHHSDNDGVHDEEEHGPGGTNHNYDGNNDGTPDADQDHVCLTIPISAYQKRLLINLSAKQAI